MRNSNYSECQKLATAHESAGFGAGLALIDGLLMCQNQAEASPIISDFLLAMGSETSEESAKYRAAGASVALVDVLMQGVDAVRNRRGGAE